MAVRTASLAVDDPNATPACGKTLYQEAVERLARFAHPQAVQVERRAGLDHTALQVVEYPVLDAGPAELEKITGLDREVGKFFGRLVTDRQVQGLRASAPAVGGSALFFHRGDVGHRGAERCLVVGIVASLYTGVFCTRLVFDWWVRGAKVKRLSVGAEF